MLCFPDRDLPPDHPDRRVLARVSDKIGVPAARIALAGSMTDYIEAVMARTPAVCDAGRQTKLTQRHLAPVLEDLTTLLKRLRCEADPGLRRRRPQVAGKAYPIGQCLEITRTVLTRLDALDIGRLSDREARAWRALSDFRAAGGDLRLAWGDLRGAYFQNALIVGSLYVDVANDTVVVSKPPVEILPFEDADFRPVADHQHYARLAASYWGHRMLPNHVLPELAPYAPFIEIDPQGAIRVGPLTPYMLGVAVVGRFASSEAVLAGSPLAASVFAGLAGAVRGGQMVVAADPESGRREALAACRVARAERRFDDPIAFNRAVALAHAVNRGLSDHMLVAAPAA